MREDVTRAHYARLADRYDENWAYRPDYVRWMTENIATRLNVLPSHRVLDVGGGTGLFASGLAEHAAAVVCADPSLQMLEQVPTHERLARLHASAEELAGGRKRPPHDGYDAILLKEVIHHVADPAEVLLGLTRFLRPGGRMLVVMLPTDLAYPLFPAALRLFHELQPDPVLIAGAMTDSGLETELTYAEFMLTFATERYLSMVRDRFMSLLSTFSDEELEEGIEEIRRAYPDAVVSFPDKVAFVLGVKA